MAFSITSLDAQFLTRLLGKTPGLSNFSAKLVGDRRAFGTFQDDPFNLKSGVVLSTGQVADLAGKNVSDGGFSPSKSIPLTFTKLNGLVGKTGQTAIYRFDLSKVDFDIRSISVADSGSTTGGAAGQFSGFDLDGIKLSQTLITNASNIASLKDLDSFFDFSPSSLTLTPGIQRPGGSQAPNLFGTINGVVNNAVATLGNFDSDANVVSPEGLVSLGDGGKLGFDLRNPLIKSQRPLYLYIGEAGDNGEVASGQISVSNRSISGLNDLSTDFGLSGAADDTIKLQIDFDVDGVDRQLYFQYVFGSEELAEYAGQDFNDAFSLELNGFNLAKLSNNSTVSINNLSQNPFDRTNSDYIYNPTNTGATRNITRLDGYTKPILFRGDLISGDRNSLVITIKDTRDGLLDSAVFVRGGTLGTLRPDDISDNPDEIGSETNPINAGNGANTITIPSGKTTYVKNFGGVGRGTRPTKETIRDADTLRFQGTEFLPKNLLLTQVETDVEVTFEGNTNTKVVLQNFQLELFDNLRRDSGSSVDLGNSLFDGDTEIKDSFDVFNFEWKNGNPNWNEGYIFNRNTVTFLNDLDNTIRGFDNSNDVINGQGGNDILWGLSGDDTLRGGSGSDTLVGGLGNDILEGGTGNDLLIGGGDHDTFTVWLGDAIDQIVDFGGVGARDQQTPAVLAEIDIIKFEGAKLTAHNMLLTQNGQDLLISFEGVSNTQVVLQNFALEDLDNFKKGGDSDFSAIGNILFNGDTTIQDSFDVFDANWQLNQILDGFGRNRVTFLNDLDNHIQGFEDSDDVINGQGGNDTIWGLSGNDLLRGGTGNDTLVGGWGNDSLAGGTGNDFLYGQDWNDFLTGDEGDDLLSGGSGANTLAGGLGRDIFALTGEGMDTVLDFTVGQDRIGIANDITFDQLTITQGIGINSSSTWVKLKATGDPLMTLNNIQASALTRDVFISVAAAAPSPLMTV